MLALCPGVLGGSVLRFGAKLMRISANGTAYNSTEM